MKNHSTIFSHSHQDEILILAIAYLKQAKNSKLHSNKMLPTQKSLYLLSVSDVNKFKLCGFQKSKHFIFHLKCKNQDTLYQIFLKALKTTTTEKPPPGRYQSQPVAIKLASVPR